MLRVSKESWFHIMIMVWVCDIVVLELCESWPMSYVSYGYVIVGYSERAVVVMFFPSVPSQRGGYVTGGPSG